MEDKLLRPKEVAAQLAVSVKTIHNRMNSGDLPFCEVLGIRRIKQSTVDKMIRANERGKYERSR